MAVDPQLSAAFDHAGIKKILLVDDAYDAPPVESIADALEQFLDNSSGVHTCQEVGIDTDAIGIAVNALQAENFDEPEVEAAAQRLFDAFAKDCVEKYDPSGVFSRHKEPGLRELQPIVRLLEQSADEIEVSTTGRKDAEIRCLEFEPQMVLLDYNLDDSSTGAIDQSDPTSLSVDLLRTILKADGELPSIVLMSSKQLPTSKQYRRRAGDRLLAVRLSLLNKRTAVDNVQAMRFSVAARDAILDACQGYRFGNLLENALSEWSNAVSKALIKLKGSIRDLDAKDFAYLIRFRLRADATGLANYIDWLFGEHLRGLTEQQVCWTHGSFADLDGAQRLEDMIEGAQDGATSAIARIFHSVRVGDRRNRSDDEYRLGDLYARAGKNELRVVITPDCDLISGSADGTGSTRQAKVSNLLTMKGTLYGINAQKAVADELLIRNGNPYYVGWRPKDLATFPLEGEGSLHEHQEYGYIGTLRPLYALRTQSRALGDLSRIGLPVSPALGINMPVSVWLKPEDPNVQASELNVSGIATIVPKREGQLGGHRVLLPRHFVHAVMEELTKQLPSDHFESNISTLTDKRAAVYETLLVIGFDMNDQHKLGIAFQFDKPKNKKGAAWLQFVLKAPHQIKDSLEAI